MVLQSLWNVANNFVMPCRMVEPVSSVVSENSVPVEESSYEKKESTRRVLLRPSSTGNLSKVRFTGLFAVDGSIVAHTMYAERSSNNRILAADMKPSTKLSTLSFMINLTLSFARCNSDYSVIIFRDNFTRT